MNVFLAYNIRTGKVLVRVTERRTAADLFDFMGWVAYNQKSTIHVVWDNLNTHCEGLKKRWAEFNRRHGNYFQFHYTPKYASWMNQAELWFSVMTCRILKWGSFNYWGELKTRI